MIKYTHRTRSGLPARILFTDPHAAHHPVIARVNDGACEFLLPLTLSLRYLHEGTDHDLDLLEVQTWENERPSAKALAIGDKLADCLISAEVRSALGGIGGSEKFNLADFPEVLQDLIKGFVDDELSATEAIYIAMRRAEAEYAGQ